MHLVHGRAVRRRERDVGLTNTHVGEWSEPEAGKAVGTAEADHERVPTRVAHDLPHAEGRENLHVEVRGPVDVSRLQRHMVQHHGPPPRLAAGRLPAGCPFAAAARSTTASSALGASIAAALARRNAATHAASATAEAREHLVHVAFSAQSLRACPTATFALWPTSGHR